MAEKEALNLEKIELQKSLKTARAESIDRKAKIQRMSQDILNLNLSLFKSEALVYDLQRRAESQQQRLEAAIVEVVRAKAKLRSIESKAEAVSTLAETEIAVQALQSQRPTLDALYIEEMQVAEQLLNMSAKEFKAQNYGGALYLANQSKSQIRSIQQRRNRNVEGDALEGVSPFSQPLPLIILKKSNLRQGPGLDKKILEVLDKGALVTGHGYKGNWIRIETQNGKSGWVFQSLISTR
jgi:hypothetical protein